MSYRDTDFVSDEEPFVSVLIPTYRRVDLLREAIKSALGQKGYSNFEVLVSDNDPSEESARDIGILVASFGDKRIRYTQCSENLGMTGNWNRCINLARGEILTLLHDDDLLYPDFLQECVPRMVEWDLVVCGVDIGETAPICQAILNHNSRNLKAIDASQYLFGNISPAPGVLFKKINALKLNGFDDAWYPCSDYDFWIRYCSTYKAAFYPQKLAFYRIGQNETMKLDTKINIAIKAFDLQKLNVRKILGRNLFSIIIPACSTGALVAEYSRNKEFKNCQKFGKFQSERFLLFPTHRRIAKFTLIITKVIYRIWSALWLKQKEH